MSEQRNRYHATGTCEFTPISVKDAIDKIVEALAKQLGHDIRLFNVVTTTHPAGGNFMLITVIAEDLVPSTCRDTTTKAGE